ncbi:hypothetical protein FB45DRAFT_860882 [Roridomyces roridus]|uniref:Uncharacterized protein n=1 Tax=Roridomyces roridus TaxID=1738132 RepID=A0AAD7G0I1_9AGAR|nr:hypothetical protein FB45DRAFT_860882 [Roridomyces roridus]
MLEVMRHLAIPDVVRLLQVRHGTTRALLSHECTFWILLVEATRATYPLGCPRYADLSQYNLQTLKDLITSRFKLQRNWNLEFPKVVDLQVTSLDECVKILGLVQGTPIALVHMPKTEDVACWDVQLGAQFPFPPIKVGGKLNNVSEPFVSSYGVCSFVVVGGKVEDTSKGERWQYIITIKHDNRKATGFDSVRTATAYPTSPDGSIFLTRDVIGALIANKREDHCTIVTSKIGDGPGSESESPMKLNCTASEFSDRHLMVAFTCRGHFFNILEDGSRAQIQHVSRERLTHSEKVATVYEADILDVGKTCRPMYPILPSCPSYGVAAAFVREAKVRDETTFTFLPATPINSPTGDDGVSSPLTFPFPCPTARVPGRTIDPSLMCMDHGGLNIVGVLQDPNPMNSPNLVLVHYHPETQTTSVHYPDVPPSLDLDEMQNLWADDTAGVIYLIGKEELTGKKSQWSLFALRYA